MGRLMPLESDIRNLMAEARAFLASHTADFQAAKALIEKLYDCADRAAEAGFVFSEQELDRIALNVETRLNLFHRS
jgi:hypothetical protein